MRRSHTCRWSAPGFTLVEMLVVIALIVLLIALLLPSLQSAEEKVWRVQCMSHLRQLIHATILYVGDNSNYLPFSTWASKDDTWKPGWAYDGRAGYTAADLTGGALWPYLHTRTVYRCSADIGPWNCSASRMSSYVMNGAVSGFGANVHSYKMVVFSANDIAFWEADEASVNPLSCRAGTNICQGGDLGQFPSEGISQRHKTGANVASLGGHVEWLTIEEYYAMGSECVTWRTRLWCNPGTANGH